MPVHRTVTSRVRALEETMARMDSNLERTYRCYRAIDRSEQQLSESISQAVDAAASATAAAKAATSANRRLLAKVQKLEVENKWLVKQIVRLGAIVTQRAAFDLPVFRMDLLQVHGTPIDDPGTIVEDDDEVPEIHEFEVAEAEIDDGVEDDVPEYEHAVVGVPVETGTPLP